MNARRYIGALLLFAVIIPAVFAQKRNVSRKVVSPQPVVVEETPAQRLYKTMLGSTAKVMFVDSMVVDRVDFMSRIPLPAGSGTMTTMEEFFHLKTPQSFGVYLNEFGDRCYYANGDTLATRLYSMDRLGNRWSQPRSLDEIDASYECPNYPFLQSDGITLFFAAKGRHSIGGYDIFMTVCNTEDNSFNRPENYGLPFNSEANDYLLAIDEENRLGYLVSDRYQPDGKVCIYIFEPPSQRVGFEGDDLSDDVLDRYARLSCIRDTWSFGRREEAIGRFQHVQDQLQQRATVARVFSFPINNQRVCRQLSDFRSAEARMKYQKYARLEASVDTDKRTLSLQRDQFAKATARERRQMQEAILRLEKQVEENDARLRQLAKEIRYLESVQP